MSKITVAPFQTAWCNRCAKITMRDRDGNCTICVGSQLKRIDQMQQEYLYKERACACGWKGQAKMEAGFLKCRSCGRVL